jgi:uncharacterized protein DUF5076
MSRELLVPPGAASDTNAREMVRAWIAHKGLHCSLSVGTWGENEAIGWGVLLTDIARHVADAMQKEAGWDRGDTIKRIRTVFNDELDKPTAETQGGFA